MWLFPNVHLSSGIDIGVTDDANSLEWIILNQSMYENPGRIQIVVLLPFAHSYLQLCKLAWGYNTDSYL